MPFTFLTFDTTKWAKILASDDIIPHRAVYIFLHVDVEVVAGHGSFNQFGLFFEKLRVGQACFHEDEDLFIREI